VLTAKTESLRTVAVGQKAEVTDLHEAGGQDVEQETADKFHCFQSHHFEAFAILGVPPAKADTIFDEADQSAVGDGHTVGVASQIFEHMVGATGRDVHPAYTHALDYELEFGWVLSKPLFNATPEEAVIVKVGVDGERALRQFLDCRHPFLHLRRAVNDKFVPDRRNLPRPSGGGARESNSTPAMAKEKNLEISGRLFANGGFRSLGPRRSSWLRLCSP